MEIDGMAVDKQVSDNRFNRKITFAVVITSIVATLGGLIFGFDIGISVGRLTAAIGRRNIMVMEGFTFFAGAFINGAAQNISMLILGRILLGFGVGFTNQVAKHRV
ncbi:sugar transport protein 5-like [Lycium barbarum]|uniref:sugar transport protein 5-like n=1 Tax=Lycium barbarum TaxID=112863 RepID=UPI00293F4274|nr:sugar transport protein 5-like [Lycium barbarum]